MASTKFVTDTATFCVFDVAALRHRFDDDGDWWSDVDEELAEVNAGNVAFFGVGEDGEYQIEVRDAFDEQGTKVLLGCPSGRIFIGCGEEVTADGLEPECVRGGTFLDVAPGSYELSVLRTGEYELELGLRAFEGAPRNSFSNPVRI